MPKKNFKPSIAITCLCVLLISCANHPTEEQRSKDDIRYAEMKDNTVNMSEYDKQRYYTEHNLGIYKPIPDVKQNQRK